MKMILYEWLFLFIVFIKLKSVSGKSFFVSNYGAYPDDHLDDTNGIQLAINDAIKSGLVSDIIFGDGTYQISSTILIINAINLTIIGQGMVETILIGNDRFPIFSGQYSQGLKLKSFSIDYDPLPFTAGFIVHVDDQYLDVQVIPPHQAEIGRQVHAILRYDSQEMRPAFGPNSYEIYQTSFDNANTSIVSPGIIRLPLSKPTQFLKGDPVIARYAWNFTNPGIYMQDVTDITIQSIAIYTSWGVGIYTLRARRYNLIDYHVIPRNGRWMSVPAGCTHFIDTREYASVIDSKCQSMGDDGFNEHAVFFLVTEMINSSTVIIEAINLTQALDIGVGTNVEFSANQQPFLVHGNGTISKIVFKSDNSRQITFSSPVNIHLGDWVCVADTPRVTIRNFTVSHNRARAILLESRNIEVRDSIFNKTSGPAILIQPSMYWHEGPEARNISLINNIFIHNNEGLAQQKGIITILPDPIQLIPVINDLRIESSTFYFGTYSRGLVQIDNANGVFLSGNYIGTNSSTPLISICNSRNISAENNCVVNLQTKIDTYYTFDENNPCSKNLSSFIDLPPSAFNSSFPPPVIRSILSVQKQ